ncbi:hypothetical protein M9H77_31915 [Catharanthus roseus]|uniref:Uncharacterized protein n=1 Tax=Catharanthus roseus TaxID=4058 RepID=A0ACC0A5M4_CATRO|nr:hypothetical protein M9H77_31915 [Catharanthus roseus]
MGVRLFGNRALVWCLAGIDYEMLELGSDDLFRGSELCPIPLYVASPPYEGLFRWRGRFRLGRVDPLEEGRRPRRGGPISLHGYCIMLCGGFGHLLESQKRLEIEVGPRTDLVALIWCLDGIDYEMMELGSDDFIRGSELCPWSPLLHYMFF